jgi:hypothetical protein
MEGGRGVTSSLTFKCHENLFPQDFLVEVLPLHFEGTVSLQCFPFKLNYEYHPAQSDLEWIIFEKNVYGSRVYYYFFLYNALMVRSSQGVRGCMWKRMVFYIKQNSSSVMYGLKMLPILFLIRGIFST